MDVSPDGTIYCKFRVPAPSDMCIVEVAALVRDADQHVFAANNTQPFRYAPVTTGMLAHRHHSLPTDNGSHFFSFACRTVCILRSSRAARFLATFLAAVYDVLIVW